MSLYELIIQLATVVRIGFESTSYQVTEGDSIDVTVVRIRATAFPVEFVASFFTNGIPTMNESRTFESSSADELTISIPFQPLENDVADGNRQQVIVLSTSNTQVQLFNATTTIFIIDDDGTYVSGINFAV